MATAMDHVQVLVDRIGPRPVSTEEENQAAQYVAQELIDLGLDVDIDEFATPTGTQWPYTVAFIVSIVGIVVSGLAAIFTTMSTTLLVFGLILTAVGWFLYYSEHSGHSLLGRMRTNGISQNVVARYLPESASREKRRRRIVLVAHIDTTRAQLSASPNVVKHVPLLKKIVNWTMPALVLIALLRVLPLPWPPVVNTVLWVIGIIGCLLILLDAVDIITHRFMPFASGANDNATGLAVMLAAARGLLDPAERAKREARKRADGEGADVDAAVAAAAAAADVAAGAAGDADAGFAGADAGNPFGEAPAMEPMAVHTPEEAYAAGVVPEGATLEYADGMQEAGDVAVLAGAAGADPGQTVVMAGGTQAHEAADGAAAGEAAAGAAVQAGAEAAAGASVQAGEAAGQSAAPSFAERAARAQARRGAGQASSAGGAKKKSNLPSWYTAGKKKAAKDLAAEDEFAEVDEAAERERVRSRFADVPTADEVEEEDEATLQAEQQVAQFVAAAQASEPAAAGEPAAAVAEAVDVAEQPAGAAGAPAAAADAQAPAAAAAEAQKAAQQIGADEVDVAEKTTQMSPVGDAAAQEAPAAAAEAKPVEEAPAAESDAVEPKEAQTAERADAALVAEEAAEAPVDATQEISSLIDAAEEEGAEAEDAEEAAIDAATEEVSPAEKTMVISAKALVGADDEAGEALDDDALDISDEDEAGTAAADKAGEAEPKASEKRPEKKAEAPGKAAASEEADADAQTKGAEDGAKKTGVRAAGADETDDAADEELEPADEAKLPEEEFAEPAEDDFTDVEEDEDDSRESLFKGLSSLIPSIGSSSQTGDERQPKGRSARQEMSSKPKRQLRSQADKRKPSRRKVDESFIPTTAPKDDERQAAALSRSRQAAAVDSSYEDTPQGGPVDREDEGFEQSLPPALSGRLPVVGAAADDALGAASRTSFPTLTGSFPAIKVGAESIDESDFARPSGAAGASSPDASDADDAAADDLFAPQGDAADFTIEDSRFHNAVDGVTSIFGRIGKRRKKKKDRGDDELFGGGDDGWGGDDDDWKGGAYFSDDDLGFDEIAELGGAAAPATSSVGAAAISAAKKRAAEIRESVIQMTSNDTVDKEIWFVALGASAAGNHGMKNFLELHAGELRGALIVNLEGVGAGDLRYLSTEGEGSVHRSDRRLQTLVRQAAQNVFGHEARAQKMEWRDTDATPALVAGMRAITLMGIDEVAPVGWRWTTDTVDIVDEEQLDNVTELVLDVVDNV